MKALVLTKVGKLEYMDVPKPVPGKGESLVRVMSCGICGSDIPRAYKDGAHNMPLIIGHEFSGIVESVGDDVDSSWIGKRVGIFPLIPCMNCKPCLDGMYEMCRNYDYLGSRRNGGFAEYVTVPKWNLIELPETVSYEAAAMLEPMAVAAHSVTRSLIGLAGAESERTSKVKVAVCGLGTIGTLLVMMLLDAGFDDLLVIGNKEFQRKTMLDLGIPADCYCDSSNTDAHDFIMNKTDGMGADAFFECVGSNETVSLAIDSTGPAGRICLVGNPHSDMTLDKNVYWKILRNQITLKGTWNSSFGMKEEDRDDWRYVIDRIASGKIDPERLITQRYTLEDITKGFELMRDKSEDYIKVMYSRTV
ncbi:MAG: galactitol-1-phosphate 5-dehydrogenase [Lachnospiraceae bacterium]|nr:galactitol-1-phosphate 5-dehydrogenase [Lachnospiraceae bacterium]